MTIHTYQAVVEHVASNDKRAKNALHWLLSLQTNKELLIRDSLEDNGAGFRAKYQGRDDSATAQQLLYQEWDEKARRVALSLCYTYRRQLTAHANGCNSRAEVGRFKLTAIHNRDSRTYAQYLQDQEDWVTVETPKPTVSDLSQAVAKLAEAVANLKQAA